MYYFSHGLQEPERVFHVFRVDHVPTLNRSAVMLREVDRRGGSNLPGLASLYVTTSHELFWDSNLQELVVGPVVPDTMTEDERAAHFGALYANGWHGTVSTPTDSLGPPLSMRRIEYDLPVEVLRDMQADFTRFRINLLLPPVPSFANAAARVHWLKSRQTSVDAPRATRPAAGSAPATPVALQNYRFRHKRGDDPEVHLDGRWVYVQDAPDHVRRLWSAYQYMPGSADVGTRGEFIISVR